jgi:hypothetical protein
LVGTVETVGNPADLLPMGKKPRTFTVPGFFLAAPGKIRRLVFDFHSAILKKNTITQPPARGTSREADQKW